MSIGIRNFFRMSADVPVAASTVLVTTGLKSPIAANQSQKIRVWLPFTVGATGGIKIQVVVPAGGTLFNATIMLVDTVSPAITTAIQNSSAAFSNALAAAGQHWIAIEAFIINGTTAGNVDIQIACNSAANAITALKGGSMDVIKL